MTCGEGHPASIGQQSPATVPPSGIMSPGIRSHRNPAVLPPFAAQHSIVLPRNPDQHVRALYRAIDLPMDLSRASSKRAIEFLAGRYCAREAIRRLTANRVMSQVPRDPAGLPAWPDGIVGSITHTGGFVSAAVARSSDAGGIGIDSETVLTKSVALEITRLVATQSELTAAMSMTSLGTNETLTLLFSAKEAVFKCLYPVAARFFQLPRCRGRPHRYEVIIVLGPIA
jgi:enterobactin synthetase component D